MDINLAMQKCHKNHVEIYPIFKDWKWYIEAKINGRVKRFEKPLQQNKVNDAIADTYKFYAQKL